MLASVASGKVMQAQSRLRCTFLEVRPYFFRSQYIRTQLIRLLKHVALSPTQAERFERVKDLEHKKKVEGKKYG
jgi:hypothetical protein